MSNLPQKPLDNQGQFVTVFNGEINQTTEMLCNARDLHKFLNVGRDFSNWIKNRIKQYGFVKDQDFIVVKNLSSPKRATAKSRQQVMIDYHLTLDTAKELAMIENNEQGRKVRRYFIECEKQVLQSAQSLTTQITQTSIILQLVDGNLSQAGRYLATHGRYTKPKLKEKLEKLLAEAQLCLPFFEFEGE